MTEVRKLEDYKLKLGNENDIEVDLEKIGNSSYLGAVASLYTRRFKDKDEFENRPKEIIDELVEDEEFEELYGSLARFTTRERVNDEVVDTLAEEFSNA